MKLDVARQSLVPAFLTLLLLVVTALCQVQFPGAVAAAPTDGLPLSPDLLISRCETAHPTLSLWIAGFLLIYGAVCTGRITIRYNLYTVGTCLSIPLCGLLVCALALGGSPLRCAILLAVAALAVKNFGRSFTTGYAFDALFRAGMYLSLGLLVEPATAPALLLLPLALMLFGRTLREAAVALAGVLLPLVAVCYLSWAFGAEFAAPLRHMVELVRGGEWLSLPRGMAVWELAFLGLFVVLTLFSMTVFSLNRYSASTKSRYILRFCGYAFIVVLLSLLTPQATPRIATLLAPPVAILLPVIFIRMSRPLSLVLYLLLLAAGFALFLF